MKLTDAKTVHCIGIGGIGVSAIAKILHEKGARVSGSDLTPSELTTDLQARGITFFNEHDLKNLPENCDIVIYSPAIPDKNPELQEAKNRGIKTISYAQALGELTQEYFTVAVAGTHGKSTTTAMLAIIAEQAGLDPTVVIGTKIREFKDQNYRLGQSKLLIIEACEYKDTFLNLKTDILIITNLEPDHLDHFKTAENYIASFQKMLANVPEDGKVILNPEDHGTQKLKIKHTKINITRLDFTPRPNVIGDFNITNAKFAASAALELDVPQEKIQQSIQNFTGTWRRLETKAPLVSTKMIDDYAHHPTEIRATLKAIRKANPEAKILCIYQPHQYNRTHHFLQEFASSFKDADEVIIPNIYKVRDTEEDTAKVSTDILIEAIRETGTKAKNGEGLRATAEFIKENHSQYDLIVTMGAGDIDKIYRGI